MNEHKLERDGMVKKHKEEEKAEAEKEVATTSRDGEPCSIAMQISRRCVSLCLILDACLVLPVVLHFLF